MHLSSYLGVYMVSDITQAGTNNAQNGLAKTYGAMDYQTINGRYVFKVQRRSYRHRFTGASGDLRCPGAERRI